MLLVLTDLKEDSAKWPELLATCVPKAGGDALALPLGCPSEYLKRIDGIISGQTNGSQLYIYIYTYKIMSIFVGANITDVHFTCQAGNVIERVVDMHPLQPLI